MNTALWIGQGLLALVFLFSGLSKLIQPYERLAQQMEYVNDFSPNTIRAIGLAEALGAAGVVLPALTGILPWLTPTAAIGLVLVMLGAMATHFRRKEYSMMLVNLVLLALAVFVAYGRIVAEPL